jgi:hypothetical protein
MAGGEPGGLTAWAEAQRGSSMSEVWRTLGPFIVEHRPAFGADVAKRLNIASRVTEEEVGAGPLRCPALGLPPHIERV